MLCISSLVVAQQYPIQYYPDVDCEELNLVNDTSKFDKDKILSCSFYSNIDFSSGEFSGKAGFIESIFNTETSFSECSFLEEANFTETIFLGNVNFTNSLFKKKTMFYRTNFNNDAIFDNAHFDSVAIFVSALIKENISFDSVSTNDKLNFLSAYIDGNFSMQYAHINSDIYFSEAKLLHGANFNKSSFTSNIYLNNAQIKGHVDFQEAILGNTLDFRRSALNASLNFENATLPDTLLFSYIDHIDHTIDLTLAKKKSDDIYIELTNFPIEKIKLDYTNYKLFFNSFDEDISISDSSKISVYSRLMDNQKQNGFTDGYEKLDRELQEFNYIANGHHFANWVQKNVLDYGYMRLEIILRNLLLFVFLLLVAVLIFRRQRLHKASVTPTPETTTR